MRRTRDRKLFAWMALPLAAAIVFASLCFPVTCTAETMAAGACPDCATGPAHGSMPMGTAHGTSGPIDTCTHIIRSVVQAVETQAAALHFDTALIGLFAQVAAVLMLATFVFAQPRPAQPPGLVAVAANLRV